MELWTVVSTAKNDTTILHMYVRSYVDSALSDHVRKIRVEIGGPGVVI